VGADERRGVPDVATQLFWEKEARRSTRRRVEGFKCSNSIREGMPVEPLMMSAAM
jgi:hypothetical protein